MISVRDEAFMDTALELAYRQLGRTWPNPAVGCVIVQGDEIIGRGATGDGGRPHAEAIALADAGALVFGATAYVTLEPCRHSSPRGPACAPLLLSAGVARVFVATPDPDFRMSGLAIEELKAAGIDVHVGLRRTEAEGQHIGFFSKVRTGLPWVGIDIDAAPYDDAFSPRPEEDLEVALKRHAGIGHTRLRLAPNSLHAEEALKRGIASLAHAGRPL
jgi:diaminohydroxyphosphoribosylaminopyrimidine deaminase / 5-amino-6-(5-phosphoribosylamino)uracil reductase